MELKAVRMDVVYDRDAAVDCDRSARDAVATRIMLALVDRDGPPRVESFERWSEFAAFIGRTRSLSIDDIEQDPEWQSLTLSFGAKRQLWVFALIVNGRLTGYVPMLADNARLMYALGGAQFASWPVREFRFHLGPVIGDCEACFFDAWALALRSVIAKRGVVFAKDVPQHSALQIMLASRRGALAKKFFVLPWGRPSPRCRIRWQGSVQAYLQSIGHESRRNLKRYAKKLANEPGLRSEVKRFVADADAFLRDGARISATTYQKQLYGHTLERGSLAEAQVRHAVKSGAFLGHILYINDQPVAYHYGVVGQRIFSVLEMGYDPAWAHHHVGGVLFYDVLHDLERTRYPIDVLDYMSLVTTFKLRTTNDHRPVCDYYLFPRTISGAVQYMTLTATDWVSQLAGNVLERLHLRSRVETLLGWRRGRPKPAVESGSRKQGSGND